MQHKTDAKDGRDVKQKAEKALINFGENSQLLYHCTVLNFSRDSQVWLVDRTFSKFGQVLSTPIVYGNQVNSYEGTVLLIGQNFCLIP